MHTVNILNALRSTRLVQSKLSIMRDGAENAVFKEVLKQAYTPTIKFYTRGLNLKGTGSGTLESCLPLWSATLRKLNTRFFSHKPSGAIQVALEQVYAALDAENAEVFTGILQKDLKAGIGLTFINKAFPGLIDSLKFMKAKVYTEGDIKKYGYLYASLKIDCIRGLLRRGVIYSTSGLVVRGVQHLAEGVDINISLDMELVIPGLDFNAASGQLRSNNDCPNALGMVFDMPSCAESFEYRYPQLEEYLEQKSPAGLRLLKHKIVRSDEDIFRNYNKALAAGYEGLVLKTPHHKYQPKRSADWLKVKPSDPESVRVIGFNRGTGKYANALGSLRCERSNGVIFDVSGFTDVKKDEIWNNQQKWLGTIIDVKYHVETPDGSLRHPRFYRERWDLNTLC